jgi:hypothetical protein
MSNALRIDVWYGPRQPFGRAGLPQRWVNILGRVYGPVKQLQCSLNDGPQRNIAVGPDQRRLAGQGDFNIDLDSRHLNTGENRLAISAIGEDGAQTTEQVIIDFVHDARPLPYRIEWDKVACIQDVAQIVDGLWSINGDAISPEEIGYDRLVAIGDMDWRDYEVTVPITVHGINAGCYGYPSVHAGVGVVMRWRGHTNWGADQWASGQPYFGPSGYGAIGWYCVFHETGPELNFFDPDFQRPARQPKKLTLHTPYMFKARVETRSAVASDFSLKVWEAQAPEPTAWDLTTPGTVMSLSTGSFILGAHHVAASFGAVTVAPV